MQWIFSLFFCPPSLYLMANPAAAQPFFLWFSAALRPTSGKGCNLQPPPSAGYHRPPLKSPNIIPISTCFKLKVSGFNLVPWIFDFASYFGCFNGGSCCFDWIKNYFGDGSWWSWSWMMLGLGLLLDHASFMFKCRTLIVLSLILIIF